MHRKFIALIVSAAIAITGLSVAASPARADDTAKIIAGIAAFALIGAAIHNSNRNRDPVVTRPSPVMNKPWPPTQWRPTPPVRPAPGPLPPRYTRYDLPQYCLKPIQGYRHDNYLVGNDCLENYWGPTASLPRECRVTIWTGRDNRAMFRPDCLQRHGYRLTAR
jgi:hypothetical protein